MDTKTPATTKRKRTEEKDKAPNPKKPRKSVEKISVVLLDGNTPVPQEWKTRPVGDFYRITNLGNVECGRERWGPDRPITFPTFVVIKNLPKYRTLVDKIIENVKQGRTCKVFEETLRSGRGYVKHVRFEFGHTLINDEADLPAFREENAQKLILDEKCRQRRNLRKMIPDFYNVVEEEEYDRVYSDSRMKDVTTLGDEVMALMSDKEREHLGYLVKVFMLKALSRATEGW